MGLSRRLSGKTSACQCKRHRQRGSSLGQEDPLEEEMVTHSSILAWEIPWTEEPGGLQPTDLQSPAGLREQACTRTSLSYAHAFVDQRYSIMTLCLPHQFSSVTQPCPTLCNLMDCSLPGYSVHGISQARILDWVVISFSRKSSWPGDQTCVSCTSGRCFTICVTKEADFTHLETPTVK